MYLIHLWQWYWVNQIEKMNEAVGKNNCIIMSEEKERRVCNFTSTTSSSSSSGPASVTL